jgi:hypothetical protein
VTCQGSTWGSLKVPVAGTTCGYGGDVVIVPLMARVFCDPLEEMVALAI